MSNPSSKFPDVGGGTFRVKLKDSNGNTIGELGLDSVSGDLCRVVALNSGIVFETVVVGGNSLWTEFGSNPPRYLAVDPEGRDRHWLRLTTVVVEAGQWDINARELLVGTWANGQSGDTKRETDRSGDHYDFLAIGDSSSLELVLAEVETPGARESGDG